MIFVELIRKGARVSLSGVPLSGLSGEVVLVGKEELAGDYPESPIREVAIKLTSGQICIVNAIFINAVQ